METVAKVMANTVVDFYRRPPSNLQDIHLVDINNTSVNLIQKEVQDKINEIYSASASSMYPRAAPAKPSEFTGYTTDASSGTSGRHTGATSHAAHAAGARPKHPSILPSELRPDWDSSDSPSPPSPSASALYPSSGSMDDYGDTPSASHYRASTQPTSSFCASASSASVSASTDADDADADDQCPICMDAFTKPKKLKCGHQFCTKCIDSAFTHKSVCPICGEVYGVLKGNQPDGKMSVSNDYSAQLPGYPQAGVIVINYHFNDGTQGVSMIIDMIGQDVHTCIHNLF